jgi:hypothetical protein
MDHIIKTPNKIINNFLTKEQVELIKYYTIFYHRNNDEHNSWDIGQVKQGETSTYGDTLADSILKSKVNLLNKETGVKCLPTYAYWRMYTKGGELVKHYDRPSCQISVSVHIASDGTEWPMYVEDKPYYLKPGDAVLYYGFDQLHWREKFTGDWYSQVFLHYVDAHGPFNMYHLDGRPYFGVSKGGPYHGEKKCSYIDNILADPTHKDYKYITKRFNK